MCTAIGMLVTSHVNDVMTYFLWAVWVHRLVLSLAQALPQNAKVKFTREPVNFLFLNLAVPIRFRSEIM